MMKETSSKNVKQKLLLSLSNSLFNIYFNLNFVLYLFSVNWLKIELASNILFCVKLRQFLESFLLSKSKTVKSLLHISSPPRSYIYIFFKWINLFIPETFNTNISHQLFEYTITVNSQQ